MTPLSHDGAEDSVRLLPTKNPARSISCPWCQVHGISLERFQRPWQTVDPIWVPPIVLAQWEGPDTPSLVHLHKHVWWARVASRKRTSTLRARFKPPCSSSWSGSHIGPVAMSGSTCITPKITEMLKPTTTATWGHSRQGCLTTYLTYLWYVCGVRKITIFVRNSDKLLKITK